MSLKAIGNLSTLLKDFGKSRNGLEQIGEALQSVGTESIITAASVNKLTQAELEHILAGQGMTAEEIQAALATSSFATESCSKTLAKSKAAFAEIIVSMSIRKAIKTEDIIIIEEFN